MNEKEYLEYFIKYIPHGHHSDEEADYTYNNLRLMIISRINYLNKPKVNKDGYTKQEATTYLESKGYSFDKFLEWMTGQTVGIDQDGGSIYWSYDVERYRE